MIVAGILNGRRQRQRFKFPLRPVWAETTLAAVGCLVALGAPWLVNSYPWPKGVVDRYVVEKAITVPPEGLFISHGYAVPVLIAIGIGALMTFLATRTRFGRYVYATGGNPEAAELAGINTKKLTVMIFALMGGLAAVSASISSARLNSATNALGQFDELYVIAAAVIGGTSLARRPRHHLRRHARRPGHAVAAVRHDAAEFRIGLQGHGGGIGARHRRVHRPGLSQAREVGEAAMARKPTHPQRYLRPIAARRWSKCATSRSPSAASRPSIMPASIFIPAKSWACSATTAPESRRSSRSCRAPTSAITGRSTSMATKTEINNPRDAKALGIETIYQTLALADNVDAAANLYLGRELRTAFGTLDDVAMESEARKVMGRLNPEFPPLQGAGEQSLSGGQRQSVAIARAIHFNARILIMDEPTAALGPQETAQVGELIKQLKADGIGIFLISHDIHDVFDLADRSGGDEKRPCRRHRKRQERHQGRSAGHDHPRQVPAGRHPGARRHARRRSGVNVHSSFAASPVPEDVKVLPGKVEAANGVGRSLE